MAPADAAVVEDDVAAAAVPADGVETVGFEANQVARWIGGDGSEVDEA